MREAKRDGLDRRVRKGRWWSGNGWRRTGLWMKDGGGGERGESQAAELLMSFC